jgi:transposase InsO family protein
MSHGQCLAVTTKALGYPGRGTLVAWLNEHPELKQRVLGKASRIRYIPELRQRSAPENLINRDFRAAAPNEKWLTDITEFQIPAGKVYLSPVIDCFDGLVISWSIGTRPDAELVNTVLDAAIEAIGSSDSRPVVHSDRGAHYRWPGWLTRIREARLIRSMSRKGCSPDNAACEGFFGRLKTELFYSRNWQTVSTDQFIEVVDSYIPGTTRNGSRSRLVRSVRLNTGRASG